MSAIGSVAAGARPPTSAPARESAAHRRAQRQPLRRAAVVEASASRWAASSKRISSPSGTSLNVRATRRGAVSPVGSRPARSAKLQLEYGGSSCGGQLRGSRTGRRCCTWVTSAPRLDPRARQLRAVTSRGRIAAAPRPRPANRRRPVARPPERRGRARGRWPRPAAGATANSRSRPPPRRRHPARSAASHSRPLSGPTRIRPSLQRSATARRVAADVGVDDGDVYADRHERAAHRAGRRRAARTSWRRPRG